MFRFTKKLTKTNSFIEISMLIRVINIIVILNSVRKISVTYGNQYTRINTHTDPPNTKTHSWRVKIGLGFQQEAQTLELAFCSCRDGRGHTILPGARGVKKSLSRLILSHS